MIKLGGLCIVMATTLVLWLRLSSRHDSPGGTEPALTLMEMTERGWLSVQAPESSISSIGLDALLIVCWLAECMMWDSLIKDAPKSSALHLSN